MVLKVFNLNAKQHSLIKSVVCRVLGDYAENKYKKKCLVPSLDWYSVKITYVLNSYNTYFHNLKVGFFMNDVNGSASIRHKE